MHSSPYIFPCNLHHVETMAPVTTLTRMFSLAGIGLLNFIGFMMAALGWAIHVS